MCIPIKYFTISIRVSISPDWRNLDRQLWPFILLSLYSGDHQTRPPHGDGLTLHLGKLEFSYETCYERL